MAFTERYVSVAGAGAHNGTSEADAWTLAEAIAAAAGGGYRMNVKAGSYTSGAITIPAGTYNAPTVWRGYNSTIGDLDSIARNADGSLVTSNFPVWTMSAAIVPGPFMVFQNLRITGAISAYLVSSSTVDNFTVIQCSFLNTQNNAAAGCLRGDTTVKLLGCDFSCTGTAHAAVVRVNTAGSVVDCRIKANGNVNLQINSGAVVNCAMWGDDLSDAIQFDSAAAGSVYLVYGVTLYDSGGISWPNSLPATHPVVMNCHATDNAVYLDNLYSGTASLGVIEVNNRTRQNTTPRTGIESVLTGEVTTAGSAAADYVDATNADFHLLASAPGTDAAQVNWGDCGAYQGRKGGFLVHPGLTGGARG